jgi:hypothetical protein
LKVKLPKEVLDSLPAPDSEGLVRVQASLRLNGDSADIVEINDSPISSDENEPDDDENPMPKHEVPDLGAMESDIYSA